MEINPNGGLEGSEFLKRVTGYPVVSRVWIYTSDAYGKVKEYNGLVKFTLDTAESAVFEAAGRAKPVIAKLEVPITVVDSLACMTLDKLERTAPFVKSTPEEITSEAKKLYNATIIEPVLVRYNDAKAYGLEKVSAVTEYGVQKALVLTNNKYGQMLTVTVDQMLLKADTLVDELIPQPKVEGQPDEPRMNDDGNPIDKVIVLSKKFRQRMIYHGLIQVQAAKKRTDEILANLQETVELIQQTKSEYVESTNKAVMERLDQVRTKVLTLWEDFNKSADENGARTFEQKLLFVARQLTNQLNNTYQKLASTLALLPAHIQPNVKLVQDYITDLYTQFAKASSWDDVSTVVIAQWRDGVKVLQENCTLYFDSFINSRFVAWMVGSEITRVPVIPIIITSAPDAE